MIGLFCFALAVLASPFRSKLRLEAENAVLRHQLNVLRRRPRGRVRFTNHDRWFFIQLYRWFPAILKVLAIICILVLRSRGETAIFSADTMHQPIQVCEPHLNSRFCLEPDLARQSRRAVLEKCVCSNGLLLPAHFGRPHVGRVRERAGGFAFSCGEA